MEVKITSTSYLLYLNDVNSVFQLSGEVEMLKQKVEILNKELYETNEKLNGAQLIKNKLEDR